MDNKDALKELQDIRSIMERSTRFQWINGWGVMATGVMALVAAIVADMVFHGNTNSWLTTLYGDTSYLWTHKTQIAVYGSLILVLACGATVFLSTAWMAQHHNAPIAIDATLRRVVFNFGIPLFAGGVLSLALVLQGHYGLTSSIMLVFYGLALINSHHFSLPALGVLGYAELLLGLVDCFVATHALLFWAVGFGILHIVLGIYLVINRKRK